MGKVKRFPGIFYSLLIFVMALVIYFIFSVVGGSIIGFIMGIRGSMEGLTEQEITTLVERIIIENAGYLSIFALILTTMIIIWISLKKRNQSLRQLIFKNSKQIDLKLAGLLVIPSLALVVVNSMLLNFVLIALQLEHLLIEAEEISLAMQGLQGILLGLVVAPICEELIFRGVLLDGMSSRHSSWKAVLISAVLFSLFHMNFVQLLPTFLLGLFTGYVYIKSRSVLLCIYVHAVYNLIPVLANQIPALETLETVQIQWTDYIIFFVSLIIMVVFFWIINNYFADFDGADQQTTDVN